MLDLSTKTGCMKHAAIVILGGSGDLAKRKLIPALEELWKSGQIGDGVHLTGCGRSAYSNTDYRAHIGVCDQFAEMIDWHQGIKGLKQHLKQKGDYKRVIFFLALPPGVYGETAHELYEEGFAKEAVLIIEKPFGYNLETARQLNHSLSQYYAEEQIYRIDHYLAKEAIQNILVFRFANALFEPIWNNSHIQSIQISASEEIGVENRGAYFDDAGIIRDMIQNHLTQLLCLLTMEAPVSLDPKEIQIEKTQLLKALRVSRCHRGQYQGYHSEKGVKPDSLTETYAEMELFIDNFRWTGVPIHIRTGKSLNRKGTEIAVVFKPLPHILFNKEGKISRNRIIFKVQPVSGIIIDFSTKIPGGEMKIEDTNLAFCYRDIFQGKIPEAYQKLLLDAMKCDRTLFVTAEETELSWHKYQDFLEFEKPTLYEKGKLPEPVLFKDWTNFEKYVPFC
jgi:glucose-6-phosphate 1-dehydrogenase